ncbi:MAG: MATE family efflux transporter [Bacteroidota bacterium]
MARTSDAVVTGPILPYLLRQSLVLFVGMASLTALSLVDAWFVGQLGTEALVAIGFTTPIFLVGMNALLSLGTGITAVLARHIGEQKSGEIAQVSATSLWSGGILGTLLGMTGWLGHSVWFGAMGATGEVAELLRPYMTWIYVGMCLIGGLVGLISIIRSFGDSIWPGIIMLVIMLVNLGLDPVLMFGWGPAPEMGLSGAALATVISLGIGNVLGLIRLEHWLPWRSWVSAFLQPNGRGLSAILAITLPSAFTRVLLPLSTAIVTGLLAGYGDAIVAAYGLSFRADILLLMFMVALSSVLAPFVGQNAGANQGSRLRKGLRLGMFLAVGYGLTLTLVMGIRGRTFGSWFTDSKAVLDQMQRYFWLVPWGYALNGCLLIATSTLNALHQPLKATAVVITHLLVSYLPLAWLGNHLGSSDWIFLAYPLSQIPALGLSLWLMGREVRKI